MFIGEFTYLTIKYDLELARKGLDQVSIGRTVCSGELVRYASWGASNSLQRTTGEPDCVHYDQTHGDIYAHQLGLRLSLLLFLPDYVLVKTYRIFFNFFALNRHYFLELIPQFLQQLFPLNLFN